MPTGVGCTIGLRHYLRRLQVQMRLPHVNSFFWIGLLLIGIAICSLVKGSSFQFDSGVPNEPHESLIYLAAGVLMIINGVVHPAPMTSEKPKPTTTSAQASNVPAAGTRATASSKSEVSTDPGKVS